MLRRNARPIVADRHAHRSILGPQPHGYLAVFRRRIDGVIQKVGPHLRQPRAHTGDLGLTRRQVPDYMNALLAELVAQDGQRAQKRVAHVHRFLAIFIVIGVFFDRAHQVRHTPDAFLDCADLLDAADQRMEIVQGV